MMASHHRRDKRPTPPVAGHSLMEMVVAIALLGLILVAVLAIIPGAFRSQRMSEHRLAANSFAEELLDRCNSQAVVSFPLGTWTPANAGASMSFLADRTLPDQVVLQPQLELANGPPDVSLYLRQVTVTVRWVEGSSTQRLVRYRRVSNIRR